MEYVERADETTAVRMLRASDWGWLSRWFTDPDLANELGPLDAEWLEHVLNDSEGVQLVVEDGAGRPLATVGCTWDPTGHSHIITDIAVDPLLRRRGVGRRALDAAIRWPRHPKTGMWTAFVHIDNHAARAFFTALGWTHADTSDEMDRMTSRTC